jgi:uncharacterized protein (TIGR02452 family)
VEVEDETNSLALTFVDLLEPGGDYLGGAITQEEGICRCSTLYKIFFSLSHECTMKSKRIVSFTPTLCH